MTGTNPSRNTRRSIASDAANEHGTTLKQSVIARGMIMSKNCEELLVQVIEAIEAEEEFDGDIPADVFATASASAEAMAEALRVACRLTKQGIRRRVESLR
jgi:hypothetical protein